MLKKILKTTLTLSSSLLLLSSVQAEVRDMSLRYAGNLPLGSFVSKGQKIFADKVSENSDGKINIKIYPAAQLFSDKDMVQALPSGALDIGQVTLSMWTGKAPGLLLFDMPYFFSDSEHIWRALNGKPGDLLKEDLEKAGVKVLYWIDGGFSDVFSKNQITKLSDFKGKRIRNFGGMTAEALTELGAASVFLGGGEVYMGLERGTIDGAITVWPSLCDRKFYEVTKHAIKSNFTPIIYGSFMNLKKWNALSDDEKAIFEKSATEAENWAKQAVIDESNTCTQILLENNMHIHEIDQDEKALWAEKTGKTKEIFIERAGNKGLVLIEESEKLR